MSYILYAYYALACAGGNWGSSCATGWQPIGEYRTAKSCEDARQTLGIPTLMRCVEK